MGESDVSVLLGYFDKIPVALAATRSGPVRSNKQVETPFHCEPCGIHAADEQHHVSWRGRLGGCRSARVLESDIHAAREHGASLPDEFVTALARLRERYPEPTGR